MTRIRPQPHLLKSYNRVGGQVAKKVLENHNELHMSEAPLTRLGVTSGKYVSVPNFEPLTEIYNEARKAETIVELGSGPGWNLFEMSIALGVAVKDKKIIALEYTKAGCDVTDLIAKHEGLPIESHIFDYTAPDISMIPDDAPTLIFSHYSIEQVEEISYSLYEQILERKSPTTLIHVEPIGWQRNKQILKARYDGDDNFFKALIAQRLDDITGESAVLINSAINSWRTGYNRNALELTTKFAQDPRVSLVSRYYDLTHRSGVNPVVPGTYLRFSIKGQD